MSAKFIARGCHLNLVLLVYTNILREIPVMVDGSNDIVLVDNVHQSCPISSTYLAAGRQQRLDQGKDALTMH